VANYKGEDDGAHGPAVNPGAFLNVPKSAMDAMAKGADDATAKVGLVVQVECS
jgi:hypothetical protein